MAAAAERQSPVRQRKSSSVSFEGLATAKPAGPKRGSQPPQLPPASRAPRMIGSAGSGLSTASTWSFPARPAASMQALRNRILITIEKAIAMVTDFQRKHLANPEDDFHGIYQEFVRQLLTRIGYKNDLLNADQLDSVIIKRFQSDAQIARRSDFKALVEVCARAKAFRELRVQVQNRVDEVYNYTDAFCVTFASEAEGLSFECVENYENVKTDCLRQLVHSLDQVQVGVDELHQIQPLYNYLESYSRVLNYVEHVAQHLGTAAAQLKRWVVADEQYDKAIERELEYLKQRQARVGEDRLAVSSARFEIKSRLASEAGKSRTVELTLGRLRTALSKQTQSRRALGRAAAEVKEKMREARRELVAVEKQAARRLRLSEFSDLVPSADRLKEQIESLQQKEDAMTEQIRDSDEQIVELTKEIHELEQERSRHKKSLSQTSQHVREQKTSLQQQTSAAATLARKIEVLHKLKSLKREKNTVRKMEFNMINVDYKEAMQSAIFDVAYKIGANWPDVYMRLPFLPARSAEKMAADIKAIKAAGLQADRTEAEMGVLAFEKWARRSMAATINELTFASKSFAEVASRRRMKQRARHCVPRLRKRFHQLDMKTNVIYV